MTNIVDRMRTIIMIACGANFSLALDESGLLYSWGEGTSG